VGDRIKKITQRVKRVFVKETPPEEPKPKLKISGVFNPEDPHLEARRRPGPRVDQRPVVECSKPEGNGVGHIKFNRPKNNTTRKVRRVVGVRDPITRRVERRNLGEFKRKTSFYDENGKLLDESGTDIIAEE
jgi:hypothetical protein